ncbi:MAG TPA: fumarate reductase/succinate dehydrogenase flavoprotein subunit, partial [Candidatus Binatia bacterium]
ESKGKENPYSVHADLQDCMQNLVGIIRTESELKKALDVIGQLKERARNLKVEGNRQYNPGWHLALDLHSLLSFAEAATIAAIERKESRGGHTRDDYPNTDPKFAKINIVMRRKNGDLTASQEPLPEMPDELKSLLEEKK